MVRTGEVVAFDVETTGLSPFRRHRVIETGAVREVEGYSYASLAKHFSRDLMALRRE